MAWKPQVVGAELPDPPYPKNTRVRGWRFQLDHERINQSDTWALAPPDMRPWLLMLWHVSWQQVPAGSMPDNDDVIAAKIGMEKRQFSAHRDILLRGWIKHTDGRIYHQTVVEQVFEYQNHNRKERERMQRWREQQKQQDSEIVTRDKRVSTTPEPEPEPELNTVLSNDNTSQQSPACPHQKIIDLYHRALPTGARVRNWRGTRADHLRARWKENPDLEWWQGFFEFCAESKFLTGRAKPRNPSDPPFQASLGWIVNQSNFDRINEGVFHRG